MRRLCYLIALIFPLSLFSAAKYPFPQNATYSFGIKPATIDNDKVQAAYDDFMTRFYEESGDKARIKWDNGSQTVSEGIGYGMLVTVYMDNATNNTQAKFDKLWKYYNSFLNDNKLMHWKIDGFNGVASQNAATDAELDVAVALMQAHKQWGDEKYLNDAKVLIDTIWNKEVNANGYLKPGDSWDTKKNPSYFSTAALELFKNAGSHDWSKVITNSYSLINKARNPSSGLVPDWCSESGTPEGRYSYDAARTPWRIAWGYVWYGHSAAKDICSTIATWINTETGGDAGNVVDGYDLNGGGASSNLNSTFLGAFACAGMVDAAHQTWLNNSYSKQESLVAMEESYYSTSLKVIYLLLLSGNMPNLWNPPVQNFNLTTSATPSSAGSVSTSPSGTQFPSGTQITLTATPNNNYTFKNWSGDISGTEVQKTITITEDMNIEAIFEPAISVNIPKTGMFSALSISTGSFNVNNSISFAIPKAGKIDVGIYTITGKKVASLVNGFCKAGESKMEINRPLSNGIYWIQLESTSGKLVRQLTVSR